MLAGRMLADFLNVKKFSLNTVIEKVLDKKNTSIIKDELWVSYELGFSYSLVLKQVKFFFSIT